MQKQEIPIFFAIDDGYIPFLSVAIKSLVDNVSDKNNYLIKVLHTNVSDVNINKIKKYQCENVNIEFVNLLNHVEQISDKLYTRDYYSKTTYYRLFIADLYPEYDKAIYLDADIVILSDIADLYNIDIKDNLLGAAKDGAVQLIPEFKEYVEKVVGVYSYKHYFNAGILLMNLDELRKCDFQDKFVYLLDTIKFKVAQDQDYLNRICKGRVLLISDEWNKMPFIELKDDNQQLHLIHYNLAMKPWHYNDILYQEYFWNVAETTEYYDYLQSLLNSYSDESKENDKDTGDNLVMLAKYEADCVGNDNPNGFEK